MIIFALMASLVAAFRDITVQSMIARSIAGTLSKRLNADVKIRTFYVTEKLTVCIEDMQINDLEGYPMFFVGSLDAKFSPTMDFNDIRVKEVCFKDVLGRLVKYEGEKKLNVKEVMAQLGGGKSDKKKDEGEGLHLVVDALRLDNGHFIFWMPESKFNAPPQLGHLYSFKSAIIFPFHFVIIISNDYGLCEPQLLQNLPVLVVPHWQVQEP